MMITVRKINWIRNLTLKVMNQWTLDLMHVKMSVVKLKKKPKSHFSLTKNYELCYEVCN